MHNTCTRECTPWKAHCLAIQLEWQPSYLNTGRTECIFKQEYKHKILQADYMYSACIVYSTYTCARSAKWSTVTDQVHEPHSWWWYSASHNPSRSRPCLVFWSVMEGDGRWRDEQREPEIWQSGKKGNETHSMATVTAKHNPVHADLTPRSPLTCILHYMYMYMYLSVATCM